MYLLAQTTVQSNQQVAQTVADAWEKNWTQFFTAGVYQAVNSSMLGIALLFLIITVATIAIDYIKNESYTVLTKLIVPVIICCFLSNGGALSITAIQGLRAISNGINNSFLEALNINQNVNQKIQDITGEQKTLKAIENKAAGCKATANIDDAKQCLVELDNDVKLAKASGKIRDVNVLDKLDKFGNDLADILTGNGTIEKLKSTADAVTGAIGNVVFAPLEAVIFYILQIITAGVQTMAEASFMLTALTTPVALTSAMLPNGSRAIIAQLTAFWTIINYKACYILMVGLSAQITQDNNSGTAIQLSMATAIFSPILAGILAGGAGMGFAKAAASVAGQAVGSIASIGVSAATGGGASLAQGLGKTIGSKIGK